MKKLLIMALVVAIAVPVMAGQAETVKSLLPDADMKPAVIRLTADDITAVQEALGSKLPVRAEHEVYKSKSGAVVITEQLGKWGMIKFAILIGPDGKTVKKIEIISMKEKRGRYIAWPNFLGQFSGKGVADLTGFENGMKAVSGATVSSKAVLLAAKKALLVFEIMSTGKKKA